MAKEDDLPRLVNFLRTQEAGISDRHSDSPPSVPAASLHVTLCCQRTGKEVPVQLLAVAVPAHPSREHITHLIGLKHEGVEALAREEDSIADGSLQFSRAPGPWSQSTSS